jgi:hypothetical protein
MEGKEAIKPRAQAKMARTGGLTEFGRRVRLRPRREQVTTSVHEGNGLGADRGWPTTLLPARRRFDDASGDTGIADSSRSCCTFHDTIRAEEAAEVRYTAKVR